MMNSLARRSRTITLAGVFALAFAGAAEARKGSFGSRGSRTFDQPAATRTAPGPAQPMQRSQTTPSQVQQQRPTAPAPATQPARSRFGSGFFAGLLGAGLLGALFGAGLFGGLGSLMSILGFLLQVALIVGLVVLAVRFFRGRRQQPAYAAPSGPTPRHFGQPGPMQRSALGGLGGSPSTGPAAGAGPGAAASPVRRDRSDEIGIGPDDYAAFEKNLQEVLDAYSREDVARLWTLATPEMAGYFQEELNDNARNGVINKVSRIQLVSGDLAEAWREGVSDYATVAMRYGLVDATLDRTTGRVVEGSRDTPTELTEVWTFRRDDGGPWKVSAIQKTA
jgi:predicted lipid-binding transport protein (Tim44 family)